MPNCSDLAKIRFVCDQGTMIDTTHRIPRLMEIAKEVESRFTAWQFDDNPPLEVTEELLPMVNEFLSYFSNDIYDVVGMYA
jgi:hypothetical protein